MSERKPSKKAPPEIRTALSPRHGEQELYPTEDRYAPLFLCAESATVLRNQVDSAVLFRTASPNIKIKNVLAERELCVGATIKDDLIVRARRSRIAAMFHDFTEIRAKKREEIGRAIWRPHADTSIAFNERPLPKGAGRISHARMQQIAHERFAKFDLKWWHAKASTADAKDAKELKQIERAHAKEGKI
jgi:hypothetical protein